MVLRPAPQYYLLQQMCCLVLPRTCNLSVSESSSLSTVLRPAYRRCYIIFIDGERLPWFAIFMAEVNGCATIQRQVGER